MKCLQSALSILLVAAVSLNVAECTVIHQFLDGLALPELGQHAHNTASAAATAFANSYGGLRSYFSNFGQGLNLGQRLGIPLNQRSAQLFDQVPFLGASPILNDGLSSYGQPLVGLTSRFLGGPIGDLYPREASSVATSKATARSTVIQDEVVPNVIGTSVVPALSVPRSSFGLVQPEVVVPPAAAVLPDTVVFPQTIVSQPLLSEEAVVPQTIVSQPAVLQPGSVAVSNADAAAIAQGQY